MADHLPWREYFEEKFSKPDPWRYLSSPYEMAKYGRQLELIRELIPSPRRILEIGAAEGAFTAMLLESFSGSEVTAVEISENATRRAAERLRPYNRR